jgi:hypothetical protein
MKWCHLCGHEASEGQGFCLECGAVLRVTRPLPPLADAPAHDASTTPRQGLGWAVLRTGRETLMRGVPGRLVVTRLPRDGGRSGRA